MDLSRQSWTKESVKKKKIKIILHVRKFNQFYQNQSE